jgi:uncharacterized protein YjbI with pentapeptide repeats
VPRPPIVPSDGVVPRPPEARASVTGDGVPTPERLVPGRERAELLRAFVRRVVLPPVRRVVPVLVLFVARAPVRPELRRPLLRFAVLRRAVLRLAVLRFAVLRRAVLRFAVARFAVPRLAVLRFAVARLAVARLAVLRLAVARFAVLRFAVARLAVLRFAVVRFAAVLRFAVLRLAVLRLAVLRFAVARLAVLRFAVARFAVVRLAVLRFAVARFAVVRFAVLRLAVLRAVVRRVPVERFAAVLRPALDLLRAVAIRSLLVGDVGGNADVCSMRAASADIQQEHHLSYFEMSSTRSPVFASDALRAMSAWATMPTSFPSSSTTGKRRI